MKIQFVISNLHKQKIIFQIREKFFFEIKKKLCLNSLMQNF